MMTIAKKIFALGAAALLLAAAVAAELTDLAGARAVVYAEPACTAEIRLSEAGAEWSGDGVSYEDGVLTVGGSGTYRLTGEWAEGRIVVEAGKKGYVTLVLDGLTVRSGTGSPLTIAAAARAAVLTMAGTENLLESAASGEDAASAIASKADLRLSGEGTLTLISAEKHGVQSADSLTIEGGQLVIEAGKAGLRANDFVWIEGGGIRIAAGTDGIRAEGDDSKPDTGWIRMDGGAVTIVSAGDGMQAASDLTVTDGSLDIQSGGGAENGPEHAEEQGPWARPAEGDAAESAEDGASAKGLKCGGVLTVSGGEISVDSADDGLHSDGSAAIPGGSLTIRSGDDGVHAGGTLTVSGGRLAVVRSYEGLEANRIELLGGDVDVTAEDDGVNANGGADALTGGPGGFGGMPPEMPAVGFQFGEEAAAQGGEAESAPANGRTPFAPPSAEGIAAGEGSASAGDASPDLPALVIRGGTVRVKAGGDGLDSNGDLSILGGEVVVDGPADSMNGALDSGSESGGTLTVSGGTLLALGASGMDEGFDEASGQVSFRYAGLSFSAGDEITVSLDGEAICSHTARTEGDSVVFTSPELALGQSVVLTAGENSVSFTLDAQSTAAGDGGSGFGGFEGRGARGGFRGERTREAE